MDLSEQEILVDENTGKAIRPKNNEAGLYISRYTNGPFFNESTITSNQPIVYISDFKIENKSATINYIDNGLSGDSIDPTELLFKGSDNIIAGTLEQKDNTLFLGNIKLNQNLIEPEIINSLRSWKDDVVFK